MKVKLIFPKKKDTDIERWSGNFLSFVYGFKKYGVASLSLPTIAALTPQEIEVSITDENIDPINFDEEIDLVGITANTWLAPRAYEIADQFRQRGKTVVLGGIHPTMMHEEAIHHADSVMIGEAETVWPELIFDFQNKQLHKFYYSKNKPGLENQPIPRWDLLKCQQYYYLPLQTTRGCPYDCEFCTVKAMFGKRFRCKSVESVIREIEMASSLHKLLFFVDDNLVGNRGHAKKMLQRLIPYKLHYFTQASINLADDEEMLNLMAESGCKKLLVGFESISGNSLIQMNKDFSYRPEEYAKKIEKIQATGIEILGSFIFGSDDEDENIFEKTVQFINDAKIALILLNILTPYPGTQLYKRLSTEGRILHHNWSEYDSGHVCFIPKLMNEETLFKGYLWASQQIHSYESIFKRMKGVWALWNKASVRKWDRITPLLANLEDNDVAYQYPIVKEVI